MMTMDLSGRKERTSIRRASHEYGWDLKNFDDNDKLISMMI